MSNTNLFSISRSRHRRRSRRVAACAAALLSPCPLAHAISAGAAPDSADKRVDANIATSPFGGVVSIAGGGSGVLIDSTHVLTAAHNIDSSRPTGTTVFINYGGDKTFAISSKAVDQSEMYHGFGGSDAGDIGIITLSQAVPSFVPTYHLYTQPLTAGTTLTFVGYGVAGDGVNGYYPPGYGSDTIKRVGRNNADSGTQDGPDGFDFAPLDANSHTFLYDFDGPDASTNFFGDPSDPRNLTLGNDTETTVGNGDSGCPAFVYDAKTGQYLIAGITDFDFDLNSPMDMTHPVAGHFGSGGGGAIVSAYTSFIYRIAPAAAAPEPTPCAAFAVGGLFLLGGVWRARRRGTS